MRRIAAGTTNPFTEHKPRAPAPRFLCLSERPEALSPFAILIYPRLKLFELFIESVDFKRHALYLCMTICKIVWEVVAASAHARRRTNDCAPSAAGKIIKANALSSIVITRPTHDLRHAISIGQGTLEIEMWRVAPRYRTIEGSAYRIPDSLYCRCIRF